MPKGQIENEKGEIIQVYELGYHIVPTIPEEHVPEEVTKIRDIIEKKKGIVIADEHPRHTKLAYEMTKMIANKKYKYNEGYFGWIKFQMEPQAAVALKKDLDDNDNVIRFLLIKTVKENTMSPKKVLSPGVSAKAKPVSEGSGVKKEDAKPVSKEELDKTIDELVVE